MSEEDEKYKKKVPFWTSTRFGIGLIFSFGGFNVYLLRNNINMAIVCMVNHTALATVPGNESEVLNNTIECSVEQIRDIEHTEKDGDFMWDKTIQGQILGAFFWPYAICQIPSGILITKMGARKLFGFCMILASITTILIPILTPYSSWYVIILRAAQGIFQAPYAPCCMYFLGKWIPPTERSRLISMMIAGEQIGVVVAYIGTGYLCKYGFAGGWPSAFYISGIFSFLWGIIWLIFTKDSPQESKSISDTEKEYIMIGLDNGEESKNDSIPWRGLFTSLPVFAAIFSLFTSDWAVQFMGTFIPTYIDDVFNFNIEDNGLVTALTSVPQCFIGLACGWIADYAHKKCLSITNTRKLFTIISTWLPALLLASLGYVDCSFPVVAMVIMTLCMTIRGFRSAGNEIAITDVAPSYAGIISGFANTASALGGYLATLTTSSITKNSLREEWQICFFITAGIEIVGGLFFLIFGSADVQPWASNSGNACRVTDNDNKVEVVRWQRKDHFSDISDKTA